VKASKQTFSGVALEANNLNNDTTEPNRRDVTVCE
jgi:hypothetical protein